MNQSKPTPIIFCRGGYTRARREEDNRLISVDQLPEYRQATKDYFLRNRSELFDTTHRIGLDQK